MILQLVYAAAALGAAVLLFAGIAGFFLDDPIGIDLSEDDREVHRRS